MPTNNATAAVESSLPASWMAWREAVHELVQATRLLLSQSHPPAALANCDPLRVALRNCEEAARQVGNDQRRLAVSDTLWRVNRVAVTLVKRICDRREEYSSRDWVGDWLEADGSATRLADAAICFEMEKETILFTEAEKSQQSSDLPHWDRTTLIARGKKKKYTTQPAPQQRMILDAFQAKNWATRINNPFRSPDPQLSKTKAAQVAQKTKLRKMVDNLNRSLQKCRPRIPLKFSTDGTEAILWEWLATGKSKLRRS